MIYKNEYPGKESPLAYFDAIFYIYQRASENVTLSIVNEGFQNNNVVLNMAIIENEFGQPNFVKTKQVIFNKAKRHGFQKVLVICDFPEKLSDTLMPHLEPVVQHMRTEEWKFWHVELLSENHLNSTFSEKFYGESDSCFSIAFNTELLPANFFG